MNLLKCEINLAMDATIIGKVDELRDLIVINGNGGLDTTESAQLIDDITLTLDGKFKFNNELDMKNLKKIIIYQKNKNFRKISKNFFQKLRKIQKLYIVQNKLR